MKLFETENGPLVRVLEHLDFKSLLIFQTVSKTWKKLFLQILEPVISIREKISKSYLKDWTYYNVDKQFLDRVRERQVARIKIFIEVHYFTTSYFFS